MITIYGAPNCNFCKLAIELADRKYISYNYVDVSTHEDSQTMFKARGFRTVPQIFDDTLHVGGYTEFLYQVNKSAAVT